ncbi:MAG: DUF2007 domain-containing protein [bacterium]
MTKLIKIAIYNTRAEAELIGGLLENNGIKSLISSDGGGVPHLRFFNGPSQLLVNEKDEGKAREILEVEDN